MTYLQPTLSLILVFLIVAGVVWRNTRRSRVLAAAAVGLLFLWSWEPVAYLSSGSLEWWYPTTSQLGGDARAIVVLAGGAITRTPKQPDSEANFDTTIRTRYAGWLYKNWRELPIVVSGGETSEGIVLADKMRLLLIEQGVPSEQIWVENRAQSTADNARLVAKLLAERGIDQIVLVTEAYHMLRAEKAFRHQGLAVVPAPCNFRHVQFHGEWAQFVPTSKAIEKNELALHEWLGLAWYWAAGKI